MKTLASIALLGLALSLGEPRASSPWVITEKAIPAWVVTERQEPAKPLPKLGFCGMPNCTCGCQQGLPCSCGFQKLSYGEALKINLPVLLYFTTANCPPCERMRATTLAKLPEGVTSIMGTAADAKLFGVDKFPTTVVVNKGLQWREVGYIDAPTLQRLIDASKGVQALPPPPVVQIQQQRFAAPMRNWCPGGG